MHSRYSSFLLALLAAGGSVVDGSLLNNLAQTPQMGWNNWNAFGCDVDEKLILDTAKKIKSLGLRDAGYSYLVMDDCWSSHSRDSTSGRLVPDPKKFPRGMKHVADAVHAQGLKYGMYGTAGERTCAGYPGSLGHESLDAKTFASWGVDYLKYDNCFNAGQSGTPKLTHDRFNAMALALNKTGRPMLYSMCNWGEDYPWKWAQTMANSWRISGDITDKFDADDPRCPCTGDEGYDCRLPGFHCSVLNVLNKCSAFPDKGIPGSWNDLDILEVGNKGQSDGEYKLHFTMWAAIKSPLLMGNDLRTIDAPSFSILSNPAILALSQDPLGSAVVRRWRYYPSPTDAVSKAEIQMYSGELDNGDWAVILLNAAPGPPRKMNATLADVFTDYGGDRSEQAKVGWDMYDLWANRMSDETAQTIIDADDLADDVWRSGEVKRSYFNATAMSFKEGLKREVPALFGKMVGSVRPKGTIEVTVDEHSVVAYRLRPKSKVPTRK